MISVADIESLAMRSMKRYDVFERLRTRKMVCEVEQHKTLERYVSSHSIENAEVAKLDPV